jgi:hypothetical protein
MKRKAVIFDIWPHDHEAQFAVRADEASADDAKVAVEREYGPVEYVGVRVVNLPEREGLVGRRRRAHIFEGTA